jgi:hypothetical protein
MSRLIDKLKRLRQSEPQPMGFMAGKTTVEKTRMQLVALVAAEDLDKVSAGLDSADACLVEIARPDGLGALEKACQLKDAAPAGGWIKSADGTTLKKAFSAACDFLVFPSSVPVTAAQTEKVGRVLELDITLSEGLLRTVNDLPVDAVLVAGKADGSSLTLDRLMLIQRLVYMVNKPVLVTVPLLLTSPELQALWDIGVAGVVAGVDDEKSGEKLSELRKAIEKLNPPAFRKKSRMSAVLPGPRPETPEPPHEDEGGEEEEDE